NQVLVNSFLNRLRDFVHVRAGQSAGCEAVVVVVVLVTRGPSDAVIEGIMNVAGDPRPVNGVYKPRRNVAPAIVVVHDKRKFGRRRNGEQSFSQLPRVAIGVGHGGAHHVVLGEGDFLGGCPGETDAAGFARVDADDVVPAVDQVTHD